jgi:chromosome segregation ATPase
MMRKKFLAQTKILTQENDARKEAIESKNSILATLSKECDNHLDALEACRSPYIRQIEELYEEIKEKKVIISDLEGQVRLWAAAVEEGKDLRRKLEAATSEATFRVCHTRRGFECFPGFPEGETGCI